MPPLVTKLPVVLRRLPWYCDASHGTATPLLIFDASLGTSFNGNALVLRRLPGGNASPGVATPSLVLQHVLWRCDASPGAVILRRIICAATPPFVLQSLLWFCDTSLGAATPVLMLQRLFWCCDAFLSTMTLRLVLEHLFWCSNLLLVLDRRFQIIKPP